MSNLIPIISNITDILVHADQQLFLVLNGLHSPFFDGFMYLMSNKLIWAPWYAFILFLFWKHYKKAFWIILLMIVLLVTLTDRVSVMLFKDVFERLRPCHEPALEGMVHLVKNHCGGSYGFISSHACNSFGVAILAGSLLRKYYKWMFPTLIGWAVVVSYSRIYLGVHYPGDVLVGALVGCLLGCLVVVIFQRILKRYPRFAPDLTAEL